MKRVLIDLEENGCTVKEAVDYLKGLGYEEDDDYPIRYNSMALVGDAYGLIDCYTDCPYETSVDAFCKKFCFEKLTIEEKPIVFSNPLMQHIGREVVVNVGGCDFGGRVVEVFGDWLIVDFEVQIEGYAHDADLGRGVETFRWSSLTRVKFVNEDGSLSDE